MRIAHFCAVGLRAGHQHRHGSGDVLLAGGLDDEAQLVLLGRFQKRLLLLRSRLVGLLHLRIVAGGKLDDAPFERAGLVRLRAFFAGGIRIAGRLRGSHLLDGTLRLTRTRFFALRTLDRLIPHGSHPSLQRARFPQAAPQKGRASLE